jgi:hypothetical protein
MGARNRTAANGKSSITGAPAFSWRGKMKKLLTDAERLRHMYQHPDSWPRLAFLCVKNIHQRDESGSTPLTSVCLAHYQSK